MGSDENPFSPAQFDLLTYMASQSSASIYVLAAAMSITSLSFGFWKGTGS